MSNMKTIMKKIGIYLLLFVLWIVVEACTILFFLHIVGGVFGWMGVFGVGLSTVGLLVISLMLLWQSIITKKK